MPFGDVVWVNLPPPNGHEQAGPRPAILVQSEADDARLNTRVVLPMTTNPNAVAYPGTVPVRATVENGLREDSTILIAAIVAIDKRKMGGAQGRLDDATIGAVKARLRAFLGLGEPSLWQRLRDFVRVT